MSLISDQCSRSASVSPLTPCSHHHHPHQHSAERWRVSASTPDITQRQQKRNSTPVNTCTQQLTHKCRVIHIIMLISTNIQKLWFDFVLFLKEVSYAHQGCIYLTLKCSKKSNIEKIICLFYWFVRHYKCLCHFCYLMCPFWIKCINLFF